MVTAVSPSSFDYEETISTLKYADRAKRLTLCYHGVNQLKAIELIQIVTNQSIYVSLFYLLLMSHLIVYLFVDRLVLRIAHLLSLLR